MDIEHLVAGLREDMAKATALADQPTRETAERLIVAVDPAVRNLLVRTLGEAADEISADLGDAVVELTVQGGNPTFSVRRAAPEPDPQPTVVAEPAEEAGSARVSLRLPETLKNRADDAAGAAGQSLNAWLVDAVRHHLNAPNHHRDRPQERRSSRRLQGWA